MRTRLSYFICAVFVSGVFLSGCGQPGGVGAERDDYPEVDPVEQFVTGVRFDYQELTKSGRDASGLEDIYGFAENLEGSRSYAPPEMEATLEQLIGIANAAVAAFEAGDAATTKQKIESMKPIIDQLPKYDN